MLSTCKSCSIVPLYTWPVVLACLESRTCERGYFHGWASLTFIRQEVKRRENGRQKSRPRETINRNWGLHLRCCWGIQLNLIIPISLSGAELCWQACFLFSSPQVAGLAHLWIAAGNVTRNGWVPAAKVATMLCKITCHPLKSLSCKGPLGKAISQKCGNPVPAELVTKSKYLFILDVGLFVIIFVPAWAGRPCTCPVVKVRLSSVLLITAICICIWSLLIHRQPPPCEHHLDAAKTVLWPHCTFLNNHVVSSSWSPSSCHYLLGFIFANYFYIGCICAEVPACCLSPAWDKERRHCELQYSGSST